MTLTLHNLKNDTYQSEIDKDLSFFNGYFQVNFEIKPCLILVNKHKQFEEILSRKSPEWQTGCAIFNLIFLLNPSKWETESNHKYSEEKFLATLKHEICHIYLRKITNSNKPVWLNEGLALYLAGQLKFEKKVSKFKNFLKFQKENYFGNETVYEESGFAIEKLENKFGREKLLKLLAATKSIKQVDEIFSAFQNIYNKPLSYDIFNQI